MEESTVTTDGRLRGARVGILEARMGGQLADLVRRHGGVPRVAPALAEAAIGDATGVGDLIQALEAGEVDFVFFLTGVGAAAFFQQADSIDRLPQLLAALQTTTNVSRGNKPWKPLKERGVPISITVPEPYTTAEVLKTIEELPLDGAGAALLHYGERSEVLAEAIGRRAARLVEIHLYEWRLPEDIRPLQEIVDGLIAGDLDVLLFTTQVQVRHLLQVAAARGRQQPLIEALNARTIVAAVGPTTAAALEDVGITPDVVPRNPRMGPMLLALADHLDERIRTDQTAR